MARIPYFDMTQASDAYTALLSSRKPLNLYRMLPHAGPAASQGFLALGGALLRDNEIDAQLREIAILRVGLLSGAGYEVHKHKRVAERFGHRQTAELVLTIGFYMMVCRFLENFEVDIEAPGAIE